MRIATWNVNSIRTRADRVLDFLIRADIDVLAMQEIKCRPDQFPADKFAAAGYELTISGFNQWNGVAFASRHPITDVSASFPNQPGFGKIITGQQQGMGSNSLPLEARALGVTIAGLRLWNLYVPNGRGLDDPHFAYKLEWLRALRENVREWLAADPELPLALMGDFNIAPLPKDMGDPSFIEGVSTHVSPAERTEFAAYLELLQDPVRAFAPEGYTFWDYTAGKFQRNLGMRIDFILGSQRYSDAVVTAEICATERAGGGLHPEIKPSDHVPVVTELDLDILDAATEPADLPMIF